MNRFRNFFALQSLLLVVASISFSGCKVGDDDPLISLRSRDARIKANWKLIAMENHYEIRVINPGSAPEVTVIHSDFNGYDLHVRTSLNGILLNDTTIGYNHLLRIKDDGELSYENTVVQNMV